MRPRLTQDRARAIVREYPDADLSAFDVDGNPDVNALAAEEAAESIGKLHARAAAREYLAGNRPGDPATEEVPHAVAPESAPRRAEVSGGAQTPRERALLAINDGCLLGYDPPSAEEVVAALEAAGLRVVDAQEHDMTTRVASQLSLLRGLPLSVDVEEALHAAIRVVDQPRGECAVALMQTLRERLAPLRREDA